MKDIKDVPGSFGMLETSNNVQTAVKRLERSEESGELGNEHVGSVQVPVVMEGAVVAKAPSCRKARRIALWASDQTAVAFNVYSPPYY